MVTAGGTGCLSLRRAPNPRETQKTPFLGTDESVTASVLNKMLPGGKNGKTKDLPQPPGEREGLKTCKRASASVGASLGGSLGDRWGVLSAQHGEGVGQMLHKDLGRGWGAGKGEKNSETLMLGRLPPVVKAGLSAQRCSLWQTPVLPCTGGHPEPDLEMPEPPAWQLHLC